MSELENRKFLLIGSYADSLVNFRGPLIDALLAKGLEVHVAAPDIGADSTVIGWLKRKNVRFHKINLQRTGVNPLQDLVAMFSLWNLMRTLRPKYLLAYTIKPVVYGMIAGMFAFVPRRFALITGLGYAFKRREHGRVTEQLVGVVSKALYYLALKAADVIFLQNHDDEKLLRSIGIIGSQRCTVVLNGSGVDLAHYAFEPVEKGRMHFLLVARLLGAKGVREYIEAARRIQTYTAKVNFSLAGWVDRDNPDSISQAELDGWIREGVIEFLGKLEDVRPALSSCTVYVLPSYREGTPRTVLEAMAIGRAIITTDAPGCRETVEAGKNGFLVSVGSAMDLAQAMQCFIEQPDLSVTMGAESRNLVEKRYDVHKVNAVMLESMGIGRDRFGGHETFN